MELPPEGILHAARQAKDGVYGAVGHGQRESRYVSHEAVRLREGAGRAVGLDNRGRRVANAGTRWAPGIVAHAESFEFTDTDV